MTDNQGALLRASGIKSGYGRSLVVDGVEIELRLGEVVAVLGHNGAGKSTLLKTIYGLVELREGSVVFGGKAVRHATPRGWLNLGVAYVSQGARVFCSLSVDENLRLGGTVLANGAALALRIGEVRSRFPGIANRGKQMAGTLSGGEKQLLALAMALVPKPKVLLLDEPTMGLDPRASREVLRQINELRQHDGVSVVIVEQKVRQVLELAERAYVLRNGRVSFAGRADELSDPIVLRSVYL